MTTINEYFESRPFSSSSMVEINGDFYSKATLERLKEKAIELGIKVPECLEGEIPFFMISTEYRKYAYTTFAEFYALELPTGMNRTVREYVLDDLFKDVDRIVFSKDFLKDNHLELNTYKQPFRNQIYTHYIDYKGIRFMLNLHHLKGDFSLETDHIIILLRETVNPQRPYQLLLSTTKTEEDCAQAYITHQKEVERFKQIAQSPEVHEMIAAILAAYGQKKRLIVAPEKFVETWRLFWNRTATAEELFDDEHRTCIGLAKFLADYFPNTVLMYATSAYGLVDRYAHIKAYTLSASKTYIGLAEKTMLTYMTTTELQQWSNTLTEQINQVVAEKDIDEVYLYLNKGYMKYLNKDKQWFEPLKEVRLRSLPDELLHLESFVSLMDLFDNTFLPKLECI